jgi:hypothetical protein
VSMMLRINGDTVDSDSLLEWAQRLDLASAVLGLPCPGRGCTLSYEAALGRCVLSRAREGISCISN